MGKEKVQKSRGCSWSDGSLEALTQCYTQQQYQFVLMITDHFIPIFADSVFYFNLLHHKNYNQKPVKVTEGLYMLLQYFPACSLRNFLLISKSRRKYKQ